MRLFKKKSNNHNKPKTDLEKVICLYDNNKIHIFDISYYISYDDIELDYENNIIKCYLYNIEQCIYNNSKNINNIKDDIRVSYQNSKKFISNVSFHNPNYNEFSFIPRFNFNSIEDKLNKINVEYNLVLIIKLEIFENHIVKSNLIPEFNDINIIRVRTPLEVFEEEYNGKYGLIENTIEFNNYINSDMLLKDWNFYKVANIMRDLGISLAFHEFIDNIDTKEKLDLMRELVKTIDDKSILYLIFIRNFDNKKENNNLNKIKHYFG